jgi:hypothetical protein
MPTRSCPSRQALLRGGDRAAEIREPSAERRSRGDDTLPAPR